MIQHNIRVIGTYYQNIRMPRLAQLLELTEEESEKHVCDMVVAGSLFARIDRLKGIATFQAAADPTGEARAGVGVREVGSVLDKSCWRRSFAF